MNIKEIAKRVSCKKLQGDNHFSWAVFLDGKPFVTGLHKTETTYYKRQAIDRLLKEINQKNS